jgi:hypothetical protein
MVQQGAIFLFNTQVGMIPTWLFPFEFNPQQANVVIL